jgi:hypothetical protein
VKAAALQRLIKHHQAERDALLAHVGNLDRQIRNLELKRAQLDDNLEDDMKKAFDLEGGFNLLGGYMTGREKKKKALAAEIARLVEVRIPIADAASAKAMEVKRLEKLDERLAARARADAEGKELRANEEAAMIRFNYGER